MSSIIEGYNYDIFISYRQKDNKHDGWVTKFVENLKGELESTFKEEISVYFDINPHDGLLETHDVDESLKDKLKCLIFIPIISRTYCDPKSFAWEHEFRAFVDLASQDQLGLKVKLPNGNVASRVLPIQIHDLKVEDKMLCEIELGGLIRAIEFIYKEPGVNRPLTSKDSEEKNTNKTNYRNQINKVANAIDEILSGLRVIPVLEVKEKNQPKELHREFGEDEIKTDLEKPPKSGKWRLLFTIPVLALLIVAVIIVYPKIFKQDTLDKLRSSDGRISVAVLPFQNMTTDTTWNVWQNGIQDMLINFLSDFPDELKVRQSETTNNLIKSKVLNNYTLLNPSLAGTISQKLDANVYIYGSIKKAGTTIRISTQLIDTKTKEILKPFQLECPAKEELFFHVIDSLAVMLKNFLILSNLEEELPSYYNYQRSTDSPEALRCFILGRNEFYNKNYLSARNWYHQAIVIDSNFIGAIVSLSLSYGNDGLNDEAKKWCLKAYEKRDQFPPQQQAKVMWLHAIFFETPYEQITYLKQLLTFDDQNPGTYYNLGINYNDLYEFDNSIPQFEKALEIYKKWEVKPGWWYYYTNLGYAYHKAGMYKKEKKLYKQAEKDFLDNPDIQFRQAVLSLTEGDTVTANQYIEKLVSFGKEWSVSEAKMATDMASLYSEADILDRAEEYYRKALSYEPEKAERLNNLGYFLIDKDRNVNEGMELLERALKLEPDNSYSLRCKGWGLYKQDKNKEALELLEKCDSLEPVYNHDLYLHLAAAKRAVAGMKKIE